MPPRPRQRLIREKPGSAHKVMEDKFFLSPHTPKNDLIELFEMIGVLLGPVKHCVNGFAKETFKLLYKKNPLIKKQKLVKRTWSNTFDYLKNLSANFLKEHVSI